MLFLPSKGRRAHTKNGQSMGSHYVVCAKSVSAARAQKLSLAAANLHYLRAPANISGQIDKKIYKATSVATRKNCGENLISFLSLAPRIIPF
jgi:hypothetical protein